MHHCAARFASAAGRKRANVGASAAPVEARKRSPPSKVIHGQDQLGLVREDELQRVVLEHLVRGGGAHRDERVLEARTPAAAAASIAARTRADSWTIDRVEQLLLAPEVAVHGGAGAAGFLGHVLERRLGHAVAGERDEGGGRGSGRERRPDRPQLAFRSRAPWSLVRQ